MRWFRDLLCRHRSVEVRTFIENDGAALVQRIITCMDCGQRKGYAPHPMPDHEVMTLLKRAEQLPPGTRVEV